MSPLNDSLYLWLNCRTLSACMQHRRLSTRVLGELRQKARVLNFKLTHYRRDARLAKAQTSRSGNRVTNRFTTSRSIEAIRRWKASAIVTLAAAGALTALSLAPPASAAGNQEPPGRTREVTAPRDTGEPIMAIVSIKRQQVTIYDADGWIMRAPVSTGTTGRETPSGVFSIVEKDKDHHSSLYDDAAMPNMERITWSGIALHGGPLPGYAASHGCVRMPYEFAETLFETTRIGMRVIIAPNDAEPVAFSDPALLIPNTKALADAPVRAEALGREAADAEKAAADAKNAAAKAVREQAALTLPLRQLEWQKRTADAQLTYADRVFAAAKTQQAMVQADELKRKAAAKAADLAVKLDAARADAKNKLDAATAAKAAAEAAKPKMADTAKAALEAKLALEPVSIFISRATQKLYVRRDTHSRLPDGGGEVRHNRGPGHDPQSRQADRHACVHGRGAGRRRGAALDRGHDRQRRRRQGRAPACDHPAGCARPHRADCFAAILDRYLGRTSEPRDQLPHGVCRGAE
jgi:lipoprotein-anchoring transpeptidase ErfK/SrfK